jgi:hypothetical protein
MASLPSEKSPNAELDYHLLFYSPQLPQLSGKDLLSARQHKMSCP